MSSFNNNQPNQQKKDRIPFEIQVGEHMEFAGVNANMLISSNELGKAASELFRSVFADFEGCIYEIPQGSTPYFSLVFNHGVYDENVHTACSRAGETKGDQGSVLARIRYRDAQITNGDRYLINDDGKDVVIPLLVPRMYNNGNPNWKAIVTEYSEGPVGIYGYRGPQYTKIAYIDPDRLCGLLFGNKLEDGTRVEYHTSIFAPMSSAMGQQVANYMLTITRISEKELSSAYEKLGLASQSRIIR